VLFMVIYYRLSGLIADVALVLNLLILLACMAAFGATLTLPGIAGIALTIGMAVDTNILIFERIREEMRVGKTPRASIDAGFSRALRTIIDTHLTVMVTAAILYNFGTGPVKGFAVSLFVGLAASLFTAGLITLIAIVSLATQGLRYDIDFTGGTLVQVRFDKIPTVADIRRALSRIGMGESIIQEFGSTNEFIIRAPLTSSSSEELTKKVEKALAEERVLGKAEIRRVEFVGPQVGKELQWQAIYAVFFGLIGILLYIALRFDLKGGVAAVVAVFHDVLVCLGALSLMHREFSLPVLAALLTIIGYSVNDTIVAYDRLRENRGKTIARGRPFPDQMNDAVNQTLSRTILTALTVFFSTAILLFFGGKTLEDFAFVLFVGVITGTYSTTYVAAALVVDWTLYVEGRLGARKKRVTKAGEARKIT
jgi:SecD/SecF fusion protein